MAGGCGAGYRGGGAWWAGGGRSIRLCFVLYRIRGRQHSYSLLCCRQVCVWSIGSASDLSLFGSDPCGGRLGTCMPRQREMLAWGTRRTRSVSILPGASLWCVAVSGRRSARLGGCGWVGVGAASRALSRRRLLAISAVVRNRRLVIEVELAFIGLVGGGSGVVLRCVWESKLCGGLCRQKSSALPWAAARVAIFCCFVRTGMLPSGTHRERHASALRRSSVARARQSAVSCFSGGCGWIGVGAVSRVRGRRRLLANSAAVRRRWWVFEVVRPRPTKPTRHRAATRGERT